MKSTTHLFHGHVQITQPQTAGTSRILLHVGADCHCVTSDLDFASSMHIYIKWDTEGNSHTRSNIKQNDTKQIISNNYGKMY